MTTSLPSLSFIGLPQALWKGGGGGSSTTTSSTATSRNSNTNNNDSERKVRSLPNSLDIGSLNHTAVSKSRHRSTSLITTTNNKKSYRPCFSDSENEDDATDCKSKDSSKTGMMTPMSTASSSVIHRWKLPSSTTISAALKNNNSDNTSIASSITTSAKAGFKNKIKRTRNIITMHRHVAFSEDEEDNDTDADFCGDDDTREEELGRIKSSSSLHSREERQISSSSFDRVQLYQQHKNKKIASADKNADDESSSLLLYHLEQNRPINTTDCIEVPMDEAPVVLPTNKMNNVRFLLAFGIHGSSTNSLSSLFWV
jgi:hypothetical protein